MRKNSANYPSLHNKSVFITGGASGIGSSLVEHFSAQGAKVNFIDIDDKNAIELISVIDGNVSYIHCNVFDINALQNAISEFEESMGGSIDILVNNAGRDDRHSALKINTDDWDACLNVNLRHQFFAAQAVHAGMAAVGGGSIINLGSTVVSMAAGNMAAYVTAKAGIQGMTRALARDFGKNQIRVNCIQPGWILTERQQELWFDENSEKTIVQNQCLPTTLHPEDVASMALFLAADDSRHCTAQSFVVDGGWT